MDYDRAKLPLYAESGVPETWIVDLDAGRVEVHRQSRGARYQQSLIFERGEAVAPEAFPDVTLATGEILG